MPMPCAIADSPLRKAWLPGFVELADEAGVHLDVIETQIVELADLTELPAEMLDTHLAADILSSMQRARKASKCASAPASETSSHKRGVPECQRSRCFNSSRRQSTESSLQTG